MGVPYYDCNATTPVEPEVLDIVLRYLREDFGNSGSRTHAYGTTAKKAVEIARSQVSAVVNAKPDEVVFTSGATESNNLTILGIASFAEKQQRKHIVSTTIEHKAVLEPLGYLANRGFDITYVATTRGGFVDPDEVKRSLRADTVLVSVMHANNETGVLQPIDEIAKKLIDHDCLFHVDAAQGFGKELESLKSPRIDLISLSGHKLFAPKGIGALVLRKRGFSRPTLAPLQFGGGQEKGLRPGTLPVALVAGLGKAAEIAVRDHRGRMNRCKEIKNELLRGISQLSFEINGDESRMLPHTLNLSFQGLDSEAVMVALKDVVAVSNGSACTSSSYQDSHVLSAMGLPSERIRSSVRFSWCHLSETVDWAHASRTLSSFLV